MMGRMNILGRIKLAVIADQSYHVSKEPQTNTCFTAEHAEYAEKNRTKGEIKRNPGNKLPSPDAKALEDRRSRPPYAPTYTKVSPFTEVSGDSSAGRQASGGRRRAGRKTKPEEAWENQEKQNILSPLMVEKEHFPV